VRVLVEAGYDVTVCCFYESDIRMITAIEQAGARLELLEEKWSNGLWKLFKRLLKFFRQKQPCIVHVQYMAPGLIPVLAARAAGITTIFTTVHQPGRPYGLKALIFLRTAARLCTAFFCNSRAVEESWFGSSQVFDLERVGEKRKHFTIYNGVDVDRIERTVKNADKTSLKESLNIKDKKVVGVVGRLRKEKGHLILLESMKIIIKELPDTVLLVVGDGPDRGYLESMANGMGIDGCIKWLGQRDPDEVVELYSIMDVVAVPSLFEGFGLTAAEAMAAGLPVVGSRVDGLSEIIEHEVTGYLLPVGESNDLAGTVIQLLSNPEKSKEMGEKGRERVQELFSMQHFTHSTISAYQYFSVKK
jgi:glycosyltransferase involved in cell wall biosynthesis